MLKKFLKNTSANTAMIAAFVMVPAMALVGGAYDISRATTNSAKLRSALESAALAAASLTNERDIETVVDEYLDANLVGDQSLLSKLDVNVNPTTKFNSKTVEITATANIDTYFLKMIGLDTLPVSAVTVANQTATSVELALVIDISSSMSGSKLENLVSSGKEFVNAILNDRNIERTSMSVVPFGGTVNLGTSIFGDHVVSVGSATVDPTEAEYDVGAAVVDGDFRFTGGGACIEMRSEDFDDARLPLASRAQVPDFWKWTNNHPWCPTAQNAIVANSNNKTTLTNLFDNLALSDGTGMDIGAAWGLKMLSPSYRGFVGGDFTDRPAAYDTEGGMKVLVIMTDGEITAQLRPKDVSIGNVHSNRPVEINRAPNTDSKGSNWKTWKNEYGKADSDNEQQIVKKGNGSTAPEDDKAIGYFKRICDEAKANNIVVYTIGYQINTEKDSHQLLNYCASDASKYYFVEDVDIATAFDSIAASVNSLRITG